VTTTVGFAGLGTMGEAMAVVMRGAGVDVAGFDIRAEVTERLAREHGLHAAGSAADLAARCPVVITMLPTSADVEAFLFGEHSAAASLQPGSLLIDMTSGEPAVTRRLGETLARSGIAMADAPVSGNVVRARKGDLAIMLGGDGPACDRAEQVLKPLARAIYRTGPLGSGQAMKALNNLASAAGFWIASEVLTIGKKAGLDPATMLDVLNASTGSNNSTQNKFKPWVLTGTYQGNFLLSLMVKDLGIAAGLARETDADAPMALEVLSHWQQALAELGPRADHTEVARLVAQRSGISLS
jgi:3-hydroxyisobutyrate dehydrogenase